MEWVKSQQSGRWLFLSGGRGAGTNHQGSVGYLKGKALPD